MSRIAILGDLHIAPKVSSRIDDYFQTCLNKLIEVSYKCDNIIILGDVFNTPNLANNYFIELYNTLMLIKQKGINIYSIMGNHDIFNYNENTLYQTSLGLCDTLNLIKVIKPNKPIQIDKYKFHTSFVDIDKARVHLQNLKLESDDVLLLHLFYEQGGDCLSYDDIKNIGCNNIFLGHEHSPLENNAIKYDGITIFRSGSLLRNASNEYNITRDINYFILDSDNIRLEKLLCAKPSNEIFTPSALSHQNLYRKNFINNINDIITKYSSVAEKHNMFSIKNILCELDASDETINYIKEKYELIGERFD